MLASRLRIGLAACCASRRPRQWGLCHGDLHLRNVLVTPASPPAVIDWETLGLGWRAYDLAALYRSLAVRAMRAGADVADALEVYGAYLRGYTARAPLSDDEREAIPLFAAARHLWISGDKLRLAALRGWSPTRFDARWSESVIETVTTLAAIRIM